MTAPVAQPVVTKPEPSPTRPGYTTTEFYVATVVPTIVLFLSLFNIGNVDTTNPRVQGEIHLAAYLLAGIGYAFYALSRGHMKKGAAIAAAIRDVFAGHMPDILNTIQTVAPKQAAAVLPDLTQLTAAIQSVDPEFSESQLLDLSNIVHGMMTHPQVQGQLKDLVTSAVQAAVKNALSSADTPNQELRVAQTVEAVEDVWKGGVRSTTDLNTPPLEDVVPVDTNTGDGASFTAPQFS